MSDDIQKTKGTTSNYKDDRGGAATIPSAVLGIVKDNVDPTRSGRIRVYLKRQESGNESDSRSWTTVSYLSPFFGQTPNTASSNSEGDYVGNPHSYGFWATPPDIGTQVVCVFLNGSTEFGYYIGCVPQPGLTHMVPAIASSDKVIANNSGETDGYGGATRLPVGEINNANKKQDNNSMLTNQPRPIHSYQAAILNKQGLIRDPNRGTIGSSSVRETPSRVFGISTPGRPIYEGGYDDTTIADAVKDDSVPDKNFKVVGRRGGHSVVLDDGDLTGKDQLVRIRTSAGHMIMMNDSIQSLFIIHANGQSYIELGREGTIDMYASNSVNIRTQGDLNLHADNNININAKKDLNIAAENIHIESSKETTQFAGTTFKQQTKGNHTVKVDAAMSLASKGDASVSSSGIVYNTGSKVNLNTGSASLTPEDVKQQTLIAHTDTLYDSKKGYAAAPAKLQSIVSRAPAHSPWAAAGQGVDVKTDMSAESQLPPSPSPAAKAVNNSASPTPPASTSPAVSATAPVGQAASPSMDKATTGAVVSQMSVNAATGPAKNAVAQTAGVVETQGTKVAAVGAMAMNPTQMAEAGVIKPGADAAANKLIAEGKSLTEAMPTNVFTGKDGVKSVGDFAKNVPAQAAAATKLLGQAEGALKSTGVLTGKESPTQTAGMIMSAATVGITKTMDFIKSAAGGTGVAGGLNLNAAGVGLKMPESLSAIAGSAKDLVSGGNFAANMADKGTGVLGGIPNIADGLKGAAAGAFDKVTSAFKSLGKPGVPLNLTAIKAQNDEEAAAADAGATPASPSADYSLSSMVDKAKSGLGIKSGMTFGQALTAAGDSVKTATGGVVDPTAAIKLGNTAVTALQKTFTTDPSGLSNLPGGAAAVSSAVSLNPDVKAIASEVTDSATKLASGSVDKPGLPSVPGLQNIPGSKELTAAVNGVTGALSSSVGGISDALGGLKAKLGSGTGLQALASTGLSPGEAAKLNSEINSMGAGGPVDVKLPKVATDSFDFSKMKEQAASLLGNPKIPTLSFGSMPAGVFKVPTAAQAKEYDRIKAELTVQEDLQDTLRVAYYNEKQKSGPDSDATAAANTAWKECCQKITTLKQDLNKTMS
jgi:hypothetical protein